MKWRWMILVALFLLPCDLPRAAGIIEAAQQTLKEQGFYYGEINGEKNAETVAALRRYQIRNGLKVTGDLDVDTQRSLGLVASVQATPAPVQPPAPALNAEPPSRVANRAGADFFASTPYENAPPELRERIVMGAQVLLARRGFYRGDIDGVFGSGTEFALRAFQSQVGIPLTGRLDMETLRALKLLPGQQLPRPPSAPRPFARPVYRGEWIPE